MTLPLKRFRQSLVAGIVAFILVTLSIAGFMAWRLHVDAVNNAFEIAATHSRSFEDFLTNSLDVVEQTAENSSALLAKGVPVGELERSFGRILRHAPHLRSISVLNERQEILASSNSANRGVWVNTRNYLPVPSGPRELTRIGAPWSGRDFANAQPTPTPQTAEQDSSGGMGPMSLIPITRTVDTEGKRWRFLFALNTDFFVSQFSQPFESGSGHVEVIRYDGTLLLSTSEAPRLGWPVGAEIRDLVLNDVEAGRLEIQQGGSVRTLAAFRASKRYPFIVVTHLDKAQALQPWRAEIVALAAILLVSLMVVTVLAVVFYRRQRLASLQYEDSQRQKRISAKVFGAAVEGIIVTDRHANIISVNPAFTAITGYEAAEVIGKNPRLLSSGRQDSAFFERMFNDVLGKGLFTGVLVNRRKDGRLFDSKMSVTVARDERGELQYLIGVFSDITEQTRAHEQLHLAASVFTHAREGIIITSPDGTIVNVNDAFTAITGYGREEVLGQNPRILSSGRQGRSFYQGMWTSLLEHGYWYGEVWNRRKDGQVYAEMQTISAVQDASAKVTHYVALFSDITNIKEQQSRLEHIAQYDALTNLPNRMLLADRLRQGMAQASRRKTVLSVAYLDLDGFKSVNDTHGHEMGDHLLVALAARMQQCLREGDTLARLGGDEFVAVIADLVEERGSFPLLTRLLAAASQPVMVDDIELRVTASLGVTFFPQGDEVDADQLLRQADQAMYQAKLAGKNRFHVFETDIDRSLRSQNETIDGIRRALDRNELVLYFQPQVNMRSGAVIGVEALIRWQHPERGLLLPGEFLPTIENHPVAVDVGAWVFERALQQITEWNGEGHDFKVSINVSSIQLKQPDFVAHLMGLLARYPRVRADQLELEILETSALDDIAGVSVIIEACQGHGMTFALDDFGTGYSSLTYLKHLQASLLKIDQSFVRGMLSNPGDLAILEGVLGLSIAFSRTPIAEGVETTEHGIMLLQLGCDCAQGFGIAQPMPARDIGQWVSTWVPDPAWSDIALVKREDFPLLFARVEHRAWMLRMEGFLNDRISAPPQLDRRQCNFGKWLHADGYQRYGRNPIFSKVDRLHEQIHELAQQLYMLHSRGNKADALAGLDELFLQKRVLLEGIDAILREQPDHPHLP